MSPQTGKKDCRIIDFLDTLTRVEGIVTGPTLLGLEPEEVVTGKFLALKLHPKAIADALLAEMECWSIRRTNRNPYHPTLGT